MPKSDIQQILLAHDQWATRQILEVCKTLTNEQFHQRFEIGPGSLHDTLTHIPGAMRTWTHVLAQTPVPPLRIDQDGKHRSPDELLAICEEFFQDYAAETIRRPLDEQVSRVRDGKTYLFTRGAIIAHVATHGAHHRAQCLNMLRRLGVNPLPPSGVTQWTVLADV